MSAREPIDAFLLNPGDLECLKAYLRNLGWISGEQLVSVCRIGQGNMNLTVRVRTDQRSFVLKQARPWVEKYPAIPAPVERAAVEAAFYKIVSPFPALASRMPKLLGFDDHAKVVMLEDLGDNPDLMSLYMQGELSESACGQLVDYLAMLHRADVPAEHVAIVRNRAMRSLNHEHQYDLPLRQENGLNLDQITPGLSALAAELKSDPGYCAQVAELGRQYLTDGPALVHGDFFPGSWMLTEGGPTVIDPEFCFLGPAEYDLGIFLAHLALVRARSLWPLVETRYSGAADWRLARRFAGAEIMRRIIGVAQLPVPPDLGQKRAWLELSRRLVCDD
jgi:5-methylthioribose kinase